MKKINMSLFAGGSGNTKLIKMINDISWINLSIITNCYDDGKSTGRLRSYIPNMLGPSDIRKNISNLCNENKADEKKLMLINDYRFKTINLKKILDTISNNHKSLFLVINSLPKMRYEIIVNYIRLFENHFKTNKIESDFSLGNAIFCGVFLKYRNFNKSIDVYSELFLKKNKIFNITNGANLLLVALRKNGEILENESDIVSKPGSIIHDIFLLKKKLNKQNKYNLRKKTFFEKNKLLNKLNVYPQINQKLKSILKKSDIIIYGPGTLHSSLFPSYLTKDLAKILSNSKAKKILVTNIGKDNDIVNENIDNIIKKSFYYLKCKNKINIKNDNLINLFFVNKIDKDDLNNQFLKKYLEIKSLTNNKNIRYLDWEREEGIHNPSILLKETFKLFKNKRYLKNINSYSTISIIVPIINEAKTIGKVCQDIFEQKLFFNNNQLSKEVIVVDGGSTDKSHEILFNKKNVKFYRLDKAKRGEAIRYGIDKAKGEIVVIFPSDNEYKANEIQKIIDPILLNQSKVVLGSRAIKVTNLEQNISKIYKNNYTGFLISKYGGILISIFCLIFLNRYVTDPLTTFKAFDRNLLKELKLESDGVNLELEIITKIAKTKKFILEIPVNYNPRTRQQGKKISIFDGLMSLISIINHKYFK
tara:strand:+ start:5273 stop:7213 length:1941 start_codon:yes stop_codon:yes gene_type:complete